MDETDDKIKIELNTRNEVLNQHLAKFNDLKNDGRWSEAWNQLLITLNYANETLKYSAKLLKNISSKMSIPSETSLNAKKKDVSPVNENNMIVVPRKQNVH